jgi:adenylate cyclase
MSSDRTTTVLFADVTGSTSLYETAGDAAASKAIAGCIAALRQAVDSSGGRVVKTIGDEVMALFPTPDAAATAAARMHLAVEALPPVDGNKLALRIGFHSGPVVQRDEDVFGDTVNLASRLVGQAVRSQVLTSEETVSMLSPIVRSSTRQLYSIQLKGKAEAVSLCEFVWRRGPDVTDLASVTSITRAPQTRLVLRYQGREIIRRRAHDSVSIGRDPGCDVVVVDSKASRLHCTIERQEGQFVLQDHSANGSFLTVHGEQELALRRQSMALRKRGWIAFGQPRAEANDVAEYSCDMSEPSA